MEWQRKGYNHAIFDFDGVICDSLSVAIEEFNRIQHDKYPCLPIVKGQADMTIVYAGSLRTCLNPWLTDVETKLFFDHHSAAMAGRANELSLFDGAAEILNSFGPTGASIVTSAYSEAVEEILARERLVDRKSIHQIAGRELGQTKTEKINTVLHNLGLTVDEAVYVGDLESDVIYCSKVPIDIIAVGYGYHPFEYLRTRNPQYCVRSIAELRDLLTDLRKPKALAMEATRT